MSMANEYRDMLEAPEPDPQTGLGKAS